MSSAPSRLRSNVVDIDVEDDEAVNEHDNIQTNEYEPAALMASAVEHHADVTGADDHDDDSLAGDVEIFADADTAATANGGANEDLVLGDLADISQTFAHDLDDDDNEPQSAQRFASKDPAFFDLGQLNIFFRKMSNSIWDKDNTNNESILQAVRG